MKKLFVILFAGLMLVGCSSGNVSKDDFAKLDYGQSKNEVEKLVGKPASKTSDTEKIVDNLSTQINKIKEMSAIASDDDLENKLAGLEEVKERITSDKGGTATEYIYQVDDSERQVYFVNGNVWYFNYSVDN